MYYSPCPDKCLSVRPFYTHTQKGNSVDLSVVIPAYNEAESIPLLVDEVCNCLDTVLDYELIVVDDCSSDATREVLQESRKQHPRLRVLHHGASWHQATRAG